MKNYLGVLYLPLLKNFLKTSTMKKVFAILAVAGVMAACNNAENKEVKADSPAVKVDSAAAKVDTAAKAAVDTAKKAAVDTAAKKK